MMKLDVTDAEGALLKQGLASRHRDLGAAIAVDEGGEWLPLQRRRPPARGARAIPPRARTRSSAARQHGLPSFLWISSAVPHL